MGRRASLLSPLLVAWWRSTGTAWAWASGSAASCLRRRCTRRPSRPAGDGERTQIQTQPRTARARARVCTSTPSAMCACSACRCPWCSRAPTNTTTATTTTSPATETDRPRRQGPQRASSSSFGAACGRTPRGYSGVAGWRTLRITIKFTSPRD